MDRRCEWRVSGAFGVVRECGNAATVINDKNGRVYCALHSKRLKYPREIAGGQVVIRMPRLKANI